MIYLTGNEMEACSRLKFNIDNYIYGCRLSSHSQKRILSLLTASIDEVWRSIENDECEHG